MKDFVDDLQQVVCAPLLIFSHHILENAIYFLNDTHSEDFHELNVSWLDDGPNNFDRKCIKFGVTHFKILEKNLN